MSARQFPAQRLLGILGILIVMSASAADSLLIDDFAVADRPSRLGTPWRLVTLCLRGEVRLENNGGFVQAALDLAPRGDLDASAYTGIRLLVRGNGEPYNLHLKTADLRLPWQSYRSRFPTGPEWREIRLPFGDFEPHRTGVPLDTRQLHGLGLVAIGRAFAAELCVSEIGLYRDSA